MAAGDLTETTVRYLYATTWLPTEVTTEPMVAVPGSRFRLLDSTVTMPGLEGG